MNQFRMLERHGNNDYCYINVTSYNSSIGDCQLITSTGSLGRHAVTRAAVCSRGHGIESKLIVSHWVQCKGDV